MIRMRRRGAYIHILNCVLLFVLQCVLPKRKLGVFEDSAVERWYLLWRAEHIVGFYKETCHLNLLICAVHCLFGITKAYVLQCLSLAVSAQCTDCCGSTMHMLQVVQVVRSSVCDGDLSASCQSVFHGGFSR